MIDVSRSRRLAAGVAGLALVAAACGSDSDSGGIEASGAWARTSPMNAEAGAAYMVLSSEEAVTITSAEVASDVAGRVELHETVPVEGDEAMGDMDEDAMDEDAMEDGDAMDEDAMEEDGEGHSMDMGAMTMQELTDGLAIPAGGEVVLEPGGLHVMMLDLPDPLEAGETFDLTLNTDDGESITVSVEVRDDAP